MKEFDWFFKDERVLKELTNMGAINLSEYNARMSKMIDRARKQLGLPPLRLITSNERRRMLKNI